MMAGHGGKQFGCFISRLYMFILDCTSADIIDRERIGHSISLACFLALLLDQMRYSRATAVSVNCTRLQEIIVWLHASGDRTLE